MIYPQRFKGYYRSIKNFFSIILITFYLGSSWLTFEREGLLSDQAIFFDLPGRKAYFFNLIIWPDELYYLTFLLILAAIGLFIITSLFGRLWCGYACPNTIMVDFFIWAENFFQGDRNSRMKIDASPITKEIFIKKLFTHITWIFFSFAFAFGWVCYFYEARLLVKDLMNFSITFSGFAWLGGLTISTYLFAGFMREKVCIHICPYGRFQSALLDEESLLVTYHPWRGEPRGQGGDCIDCNRCYITCPMGIDIRDGLQMSCIGCGLCIDACDTVMLKIGKEKGLINYTSIKYTKELEKAWPQKPKKRLILTKKIYLYSFVFLISLISLITALMEKEDLLIQIVKDPNPIFIRAADGSIRNSYNLLVTNKTIKNLEGLCLTLEGLPKPAIKFQGQENLCYNLKAGTALEGKILVSLDYNQSLLIEEKFLPITFILGNSRFSSIFYLKK
jgi:cytochrome c oxidase accessory protein FixG